MCGRFALGIPRKRLRERFGLDEVPEAPTRYNIAPGQTVETVVQDASGRRIELATWGLVPAWSRDGASRTPLINARSETAADKPAFRAAMAGGRCLVPLQGFYEWSGPAGRRLPWFFTARQPGALLALAAVLATGTGPDGRTRAEVAILTCRANALVAPVHQRMPVLVRREDDARWLDPGLHDPARLADILAPRDWPEMTAYRVGSRVNSTASQGPDLIEPLRERLGWLI